MLEIRYYKDGEAGALFELFQKWDIDVPIKRDVFDASLKKVIADRANRLLMAWHDGELIGYAQITLTNQLGFETFYEVAQLLVHPVWRSRGIGRKILSAVEEIALSEGIRVIKLSSQAHRDRAHAFYQREQYENFKTSKFFEKKLK